MYKLVASDIEEVEGEDSIDAQVNDSPDILDSIIPGPISGNKRPRNLKASARLTGVEKRKKLA